MPIQTGDIKLIASKVMDDVPNGGGGPSAVVIPDGANNSIFFDVTERQRAIGGVAIRQLFGAVQTGDTDAYMDPTLVLSQLPNDPNVSITLAKTTMFARRTDIANAIENYLIASSEWGGYLLENHVAGQRSIQLFQRPGMPPPAVGRTLVLVQNEGLPSQVMQYVRITKVVTTQRTFTYSGNGAPVDYVADVLDCDLTDVLRSNFAGSPPNRFYVRDASKTVVRDTTVANAATFYGASPLTAVGHLGDSVLHVSSVYTQLVPSARTESAALDQKPAAQRVLTLAELPRRIEVGVTPHTMRIRVGQENRSFAWVQMLKPLPARGTIVISYMALGNWYTILDDGSGAFTGSGVGTVNYQTGSVSITLPSIPDAGSSIIFQWGETTAYTSRAGQAGFRAPEFAWALPHQGIKPGSAVVTWLSGGVLKTATDSGQGGLTGASGGGEIDYATGKIYLRPTAMIDAGGEFQTEYQFLDTVTQNFPGVSPDAGGFASIVLDAAPAPKSVSVKWITVRNVSASTGTSEIVSSSGINNEVAAVGGVLAGRLAPTFIGIPPGGTAEFSLTVPNSFGEGTYHWEIIATEQGVTAASICAGGVTTGTFLVVEPVSGGIGGRFDFELAADAPIHKKFIARASDSNGKTVATSTAVYVMAPFVPSPEQPEPPPPPSPPPPPPPPPPPAAIQTREPLSTNSQRGEFGGAAIAGMYLGGVDSTGKRVYVGVLPSYAVEYGAYYDPPAQDGEVWTAAQIAYGKPMTSLNGNLVTYKVWDENFATVYGVQP